MRPNTGSLALCLIVMFALSLLSGSVLFARQGVAATEVELPDVGMLPGSPFYFVKTFLENLRLGLIRAPEEKAVYIAHLLEVRLAEALALAGRGQTKRLESTAARYQELAGRGAAELERAEEGDRDLTEALLALEAATRKSQEVLGGVMTQVPEQARHAIQTALQAANLGRETCLRVMEKVSAGQAPGRPEVIDGFLNALRGRSPGGPGAPGDDEEDDGDD